MPCSPQRVYVNSSVSPRCDCLPRRQHCKLGLRNRDEYWEPRGLGYRFLAEAKRLWELEQTAGASLTTLQASLVINLLLNMCGLDKLGRTYAIRAVAMADELSIFTPSTRSEDKRWRESSGFTAWCLYFSVW